MIFTTEQAWDTPSRFAAPRCRRCHGEGTVWTYMATDGQGFDQQAINLCSCVTRKKGFRP